MIYVKFKLLKEIYFQKFSRTGKVAQNLTKSTKCQTYDLWDFFTVKTFKLLLKGMCVSILKMFI